MSNITRDDLAASATNVEASKRIAAEIARRQKTDPKFTINDLRREPEQSTPRAARSTGALTSAASPRRDARIEQRITKEDFAAFLDASRAKKIDAEVQRRRHEDPKFTIEDLRREVLKPQTSVASRQAAPVFSIGTRDAGTRSATSARAESSRAEHLKAVIDLAATHRPGEKRSDAQRRAYTEMLGIGKELGVPYAQLPLIRAIADVMNGHGSAALVDEAASELSALVDRHAAELGDGPEAA
jgi:hypothetical protein